MKKLILKSVVFVLPFFVIYFILSFFYLNIPGDLIRTGYIMSNSNYRDIFSTDIPLKKKFTLVSNLSKTRRRNFKIFTIGDSFSNQNSRGYNNYLASNGRVEVLNLDGLLNSNLNPIQSVINFINGDVLDSVKVDYLLLQLVERQSVNRTTDDTINITTFKNLISKKLPSIKRDENNSQFFSNTGFKLIQTNIEYLFDQKPTYSKTFRVSSSKPLFTDKPAEILFSEDDIGALESNNDKQKIEELNSQLNSISRELKKKNIQFIVLICPDKFDFYYNYIEKRRLFNKPCFFDEFSKIEKEYLWLNAKELLSKDMDSIKDLYYYDDTHFSPIAAKLIANEIIDLINK